MQSSAGIAWSVEIISIMQDFGCGEANTETIFKASAIAYKQLHQQSTIPSYLTDSNRRKSNVDSFLHIFTMTESTDKVLVHVSSHTWTPSGPQ